MFSFAFLLIIILFAIFGIKGYFSRVVLSAMGAILAGFYIIYDV
jgi:hypothetical protein